MRAPIYVAQEMGQGLGCGALLFRSMPGGAAWAIIGKIILPKTLPSRFLAVFIKTITATFCTCGDMRGGYQ
jgi:hypothetical protein